jgi:hypothetical protein
MKPNLPRVTSVSIDSDVQIMFESDICGRLR